MPGILTDLQKEPWLSPQNKCQEFLQTCSKNPGSPPEQMPEILTDLQQEPWLSKQNVSPLLQKEKAILVTGFGAL
jgi:hypothetical protein